MEFFVHLVREGETVWFGECDTERAALCGIYRVINGKSECLLPDSETLRAALPYRYRKAFDRATLWWTQEYTDVIRMDLRDYQGFPMGSLFAQLN